MNINRCFLQWWDEFGSGIRPLPEHDKEEHAKRITDVAFEAGFLLGHDKDFDNDCP